MGASLSWGIDDDVKSFDVSLIPHSIKMDDFVYDMLYLSMNKDPVKMGEWLYNLRDKLVKRIESKKRSGRRCKVREASLKVRMPNTKTMLLITVETNYPGTVNREDLKVYLILQVYTTKLFFVDTKDIENNMIERALFKSGSRSDR